MITNTVSFTPTWSASSVVLQRYLLSHLILSIPRLSFLDPPSTASTHLVLFFLLPSLPLLPSLQFSPVRFLFLHAHIWRPLPLFIHSISRFFFFCRWTSPFLYIPSQSLSPIPFSWWPPFSRLSSQSLHRLHLRPSTQWPHGFSQFSARSGRLSFSVGTRQLFARSGRFSLSVGTRQTSRSSPSYSISSIPLRSSFHRGWRYPSLCPYSVVISCRSSSPCVSSSSWQFFVSNFNWWSRSSEHRYLCWDQVDFLLFFLYLSSFCSIFFPFLLSFLFFPLFFYLPLRRFISLSSSLAVFIFRSFPYYF